MKKDFFGVTPSGETVTLYTIENGSCSLTVSDRGATVTSFRVFGKEIVAGFDTLADYLQDDSHQGGTIGRVANRIDGSGFVMDGRKYTLTDNDNGNCLHGGAGFDTRMWTLEHHSEDKLSFSYLSTDGEEGFPSSLKATVSFIISDSAMIIEYTATPYGKTPIALTNHSYFNLDGFGGDVKNHTAIIYADKYTEVDENLIPNGKRPPVFGTALDFTSAHKIGERIYDGIDGYDHNYILTPRYYREVCGKEIGLAAEVWNDELKLLVYTDQPGIQFYTGNFLGSGPNFKGNISQVRHGAFCLEPQTEPNCVNNGEAFYEAGEVYRQISAYCVEKI